MHRSNDRILTTHTGSLPRPDELAAIISRRETQCLNDTETTQLPDLVRQAVFDIVARQHNVGVDIASDGEMSKIGYSTYVKERLSGFDGEAAALSLADLDDYPGLAETALDGMVTGMPACTGPVKYIGHDELQTDLTNLNDALSDTNVTGGVIPAASPGVISLFLDNQHYNTDDEYLYALADAMAEEYQAITRAGLTVQIDAPDLAMGRHAQYTHLDLEAFRNRIAIHVEALNHALRTVDPQQVRLHLCWGNYAGPHHHDVALADIIDIVLQANVGALVFEAANPRHAHEWSVFETTILPDDKIIIPGVIDTCTNYIEHPELVAQRIIRYANLVGKQRVIAGTDCGLSTFATFHPVAADIAWAKLETLTAGATLANEHLW
ncbi:cobalamin-independent methionine synthase II family protein [Saccharopolyspora tripterygii]